LKVAIEVNLTERPPRVRHRSPRAGHRSHRERTPSEQPSAAQTRPAL